MEGSALHQALKTLCLNTDWNYAVFWKLDPRARMMLTCEDAYYDKNDPSGSTPFKKRMDNLPDEQYAQDILDLAVAKMCSRRYTLGEGIVGQVAITDKHMWIFGDQYVNIPDFSFEDYDEWKIQFATGITTIAVVGVVPHGVVQLGSLNHIPEDLKMVNHIRDIVLDLQNSLMGCTPTNTSSYNDAITSLNYGVNTISDLDRNGDLGMPGASNVQSETDSMNTLKTSFKFPAGYELYEALGPAFYSQNDNHSYQKLEEMPGTSSTNLLTPNSGSEHLLEAVVANVSQSDSEFSNSVKWVETHFNDMQTSTSGCYSFESSLGFSSASHSRCSDPLVMSQESPANVTKKRAKPGESSRPRPRDRQLIQDRIKELRELVPNGSKCSIDSLLERTIKHMLFMQSVTKHADKIDKYAESKLVGKETGIRGTSSHELGSSWAMEVGNDMKVCPVTVENVGTNGQMLVEMMCEEGIHFLEIADAIRSLGLTILKGVTEPDGDKTWMCFVVEGQNNRNVHRMDILWLLVQILQSKAKSSSHD